MLTLLWRCLQADICFLGGSKGLHGCELLQQHAACADRSTGRSGHIAAAPQPYLSRCARQQGTRVLEKAMRCEDSEI